METTAFAPVLAMVLPGVITSIVMGVQAPKLNRQWRERRDAKLRAATERLHPAASAHQ